MVIAIVVLNPWILGLLLNRPVAVPLALLLGFATMKVLEAAGNALSMFLNGLGVVDAQVAFAIVMGIVASILKMKLARDFGMASFIWITVLCYAVFSVAPLLVIANRTLHRLSPR